MYSITSSSLILFFVISIPYVFLLENTPLIAVTKGVIKTENALPVSVFWYHPNFIEGVSQIVYFSDNGTKFTGYFTIESYTGFCELPPAALRPDGSTGNYCAALQPAEETSNIISSCKPKIQWMYDRQEVLSSLSIRELIIPGTHESAAYTSSDGNFWTSQSVTSHWIHCQTESIKTQLMDGIRYLDLRPSLMYEGTGKTYFITTGGVNLVPMSYVGEQIREFMDVSKDIVIVSFQGAFKGFGSDEDHLDFINYLEFFFGNRTHARRNWTFTLNQFWIADQRLILSYNHDVYRLSHYMWPPISQYWSDVQTINQLHSHLDALHQNHKSDVTPYAAMAVFTYFPSDLVLNTFNDSGTQMRWAERLGRNIPRWYAEEWSSAAHVIAVDYYQTSGIVDIAIQLNEKRAKEFLSSRALPITNTKEN